MIRFVRYAVLLLAGLALVFAWTAFNWDGPNRPRVPAIELSPRERDGGGQPRRTGAQRSGGRDAGGSPTDPGEGATPAPPPPPAPAGDDDESESDEGDADDRDDGDDGDD